MTFAQIFSLYSVELKNCLHVKLSQRKALFCIAKGATMFYSLELLFPFPYKQDLLYILAICAFKSCVVTAFIAHVTTILHLQIAKKKNPSERGSKLDKYLFSPACNPAQLQSLSIVATFFSLYMLASSDSLQTLMKISHMEELACMARLLALQRLFIFLQYLCLYSIKMLVICLNCKNKIHRAS